MRLLLLLTVLMLAGCGGPPQAAPPAPSPSPTPQLTLPAGTPVPGPRPREATLAAIADGPAAGRLDGRPFAASVAILWNDAERAWLTFADPPPRLGGRFDPRAHAPSAPSFVVDLDVGRLSPGRWELRAGAPPPADCPVTGVALLRFGKGRAERQSRDWSLALQIDHVMFRAAVDQTVPAYDIDGRILIVFPQAWLNGRFLAHDFLRKGEVRAGEPSVPTP